MIVISDTLGVYGGSHTLMMRMCQWMNDHGLSSVIICRSDSNKEVVNRIKSVGTRVICQDMRNWKKGIRLIRQLQSIEEITVLSFTWNNYLDMECIKKRGRLSFSNTIYCIHPATFKKGLGFHLSILRKIGKKSYGKIVSRMVNTNSIIMMDELCIDESNAFFDTDVFCSARIIRLPMYCIEKENRDEIINAGYESNEIMTASRADFPYKGYLVGLVDDFVLLKKDYPQLVLKIVSEGKDIEELKNKIREASISIQKDIHLLGWMEYTQLLKEIENCKFFIGQGTSSIDAALQYKPSIVVKDETYENISDHFISEKPGYLGTEKECCDSALIKMREVLSMNKYDYGVECIKSFENVKDTYDIDKCMRDMITHKPRVKSCVLSGYEVDRHWINNLLNRIRYTKG